MESIVVTVYRCIWGLPFIFLLLAVGVYFSYRLRWVQVRCLKQAFTLVLCSHKTQTSVVGDISNFAALCTALSATLGTGNIVGIAVALSLGGPGALFWLLLSSFFSLATKYGEGFLAIVYRRVGSDRKIAGGPMYYIEKGMGQRWLAQCFAFFGACVALVGIGTLAQTNSIAAAANSLGVPSSVTAVILFCVVAIVTCGGIHRIAEWAEKIVPVMTLGYLGIALLILVCRAHLIGPALKMILVDAFAPQALWGGSCGAAFTHALQIGMSRGIFCHEAGLGSAAIASAAAKVNHPQEQGLMAMVGAFMSILICAITGLVLMVTASDTGIFTPDYPVLASTLTAHAFGAGLGIFTLGSSVVHISILFFAFTTIIGWNYYGEKCIQYLFGTKAILGYRLLFLIFVGMGPFLHIEQAFIIADIVIGLMAIPNILALWFLRREIIAPRP